MNPNIYHEYKLQTQRMKLQTESEFRNFIIDTVEKYEDKIMTFLFLATSLLLIFNFIAVLIVFYLFMIITR